MEQDSPKYRICKKCLTRDLVGQDEYFKSLQEYIEGLDEDVKAAGTLYEDRLKICRECDMLMEAMCRSCGCYVELRAAIARNSCPKRKW